MVKTQNVDIVLLENAIERSGLKSTFIAEQLGVTPQAFNSKRRGKTSFRQSEVYVMCDLLRLTNDERVQIFFPEMLG